jgi:outer membrane protein assembly factor BamE (lipoprotein component of BamABCDE complex)
VGIEGYFSVLASILVIGLTGSVVCLLRRRRKSALFALATTFVLAGAWYTLVIVDTVANLLFFPDDTIYAAGYSGGAFREIRVGQSQQEVLALIGEPLNRSLSWDDRREYWYYSRHGTRFDNYWNKIVVFDAFKGRVVSKVDELYSD